MIVKQLPKNPRIILLANDRVGLEVAKYLKKCRENIVALILHPKNNSRLFNEIKKIVNIRNIFTANQIKLPKYLEKIKELEPDIAICAWFGYILKKRFINIFPAGCINLHNSYLPYNRGKYPHVWSIYTSGKYGVSIHYIEKNIDTGPIVAKKKIKIKITDIAGTLYERALEEIVKLFIKIWPKLKQGKIKSMPQNNKVATFHLAKDIEKIDFIDLDKKYSACDLINQLRARSFQDRTYAYFLYKGKRIYVKLLLSDQPNF